MPTFTFNNGTDTLILTQPAVKVASWERAFVVGPSRGRNLTIARQSGTEPRDRERGELPFTLEGVKIDGRWDLDGTPNPDKAANVRRTLMDIAAFLDTNRRRHTLTIEESGLALVAGVEFEEFGQVRFPAPWVAVTSALFTVHFGMFEEGS